MRKNGEWAGCAQGRDIAERVKRVSVGRTLPIFEMLRRDPSGDGVSMSVSVLSPILPLSQYHVCMYICVCPHTYVYTYINIYISISVSIPIPMPIPASTSILYLYLDITCNHSYILLTHFFMCLIFRTLSFQTCVWYHQCLQGKRRDNQKKDRWYQRREGHHFLPSQGFCSMKFPFHHLFHQFLPHIDLSDIITS